MFSGGEDCTIKLSVEWSELISQKKMTSKAVRVYGLDWFLHLDIDDLVLHISVGFKQIPDAPVSCCATQIRYIIDSMDPNGARYTITRGTAAVGEIKSNEVYVLRSEIKDGRLLNDGWITVFAKLQIFESVQFSSIPAHFAYSFPAPAQCVYPVAERNGLIYLLVKHKDVSEESKECAVQCMIPFDKESTVTLAMIQAKPKAFTGTSINMETRQIVVTQVDKEGERIQLDVVDLSGGVQTRVYPVPLPENDINNDDFHDRRWRPSVFTRRGLIIADNETGFVDDGISVRFRFWLLTDQITLFSQATRDFANFAIVYDQLQSMSYNALYCAFISDWWHLLVFDLDEPGSVWKEYEMCPTPTMSSPMLLHAWSEPVLAAHFSINERKRLFLFGLKFTTTDCLLVPFLSLPQGLDIDFNRKTFNPDSLLLLEVERNELVLLHWTVPRLKVLALLAVQRLLGELMRMDGQGQPMWTRWRDKLERIIGRKALTHLLTNALR